MKQEEGEESRGAYRRLPSGPLLSALHAAESAGKVPVVSASEALEASLGPAGSSPMRPAALARSGSIKLVTRSNLPPEVGSWALKCCIYITSHDMSMQHSM